MIRHWLLPHNDLFEMKSITQKRAWNESVCHVPTIDSLSVNESSWKVFSSSEKRRFKIVTPSDSVETEKLFL